MDPDANLKEQQEIASRINEDIHDQNDPFRLAELVEALHEWISRGGALPKAWQGDGATAVNRFVTHPETCFCNDAPHRRGMGCL